MDIEDEGEGGVGRIGEGGGRGIVREREGVLPGVEDGEGDIAVCRVQSGRNGKSYFGARRGGTWSTCSLSQASHGPVLASQNVS